jgi:hypothetical protein
VVRHTVILYRLQISYGDGWATQWFGTVAEARSTARDCTEWETHIDKVDIPPGKEGLILALNNADVHRINWDGELIK